LPGLSLLGLAEPRLNLTTGIRVTVRVRVEVRVGDGVRVRVRSKIG